MNSAHQAFLTADVAIQMSANTAASR